MRLFFTGLLAAALAAPIPAAAVPRLAFEQIVDQSPRILHGRVLGSSVGSSGPFIWTHYRVAVLDGLKGVASGEITVSEPGGTLNGITQQVSGAGEFHAGDEVVLFLYQTPIGYWRTTGYWQGKFQVEEDGGVKHVSAELQETPVSNPNQRAARRVLSGFNGMSLDDFKAAIRQQAVRP
ncbi:MAG: hypothetical protein ABI995_05880 [Acidobacteriota bacterium]